MKKWLQSPVLFLLILLVALNFVNGDFRDPLAWLMDKLILLPGIIIGLSFHEFAHGLVSHMLGDPLPKLQGRLTVNPLAHIDPFGFLALLFAGFGWGIPVQIDPRYYKHPRRDELLVSLAGVAMNFLIAIVFSFLLKGLLMLPFGAISARMAEILIQILMAVININLVLMVFNLLPVPPLDGFGILTQLLDLRRYSWYGSLYEKGFLILLVLIVFNVTDFILGPCVSALSGWLIDHVIF